MTTTIIAWILLYCGPNKACYDQLTACTQYVEQSPVVQHKFHDFEERAEYAVKFCEATASISHD